MSGLTGSMTGIWILILIITLVIEIATMGLTTIWFTGGAAVAFILSLLNLPVAVQIAAFLVVSFVLLFFTRPVAVKYFNKDRVQTNSDALVGKEGVVVADINNIENLGRVLIGGKEWSARAANEHAKIAVGAVVVVRAIEGVKLIVEETGSVSEL